MWAESVLFAQPSSRWGTQPPIEVKLKEPSQFRLIGKPVHRIDTPDKAIGKTVYGIDVMRPGMKFAAPMASPLLGAKVGSVDQSKALAVPGVRQAVVVDDLVAVVGLRDTQCSLGGCNVGVVFQGAFCQRP
jgi:CO/xanthine dehydrogenase Mo-binding subunit